MNVAFCKNAVGKVFFFLSIFALNVVEVVNFFMQCSFPNELSFTIIYDSAPTVTTISCSLSCTIPHEEFRITNRKKNGCCLLLTRPALI